MIEKFRCSQCGATAMDELENQRLRCQYCHTLYQQHVPPEAAAARHGPTVIIGKNAKVVFGAHANVVIRGSLQIEDGADVEVLGRIEIVEPPDPEKVQAAKDRLARGE